MNRRSDIDRVLQVWMTDGPTAIPDRVVDVVATRIAVQRQRRAWPFPRRTNVTTQIKLVAALAAAVIVAVVGYNLLPGTSGPGAPTAAPTPTAQPTARVTTAPSAGAVLPPWYTTDETPTGAGILEPGSHATRSFRPSFRFSVPEGWVNSADAGTVELFPDTPANQAEFARAERLAQSIAMGLHDSPWFFCQSVENNRGATAAEMAAAAAANEALATTALTDVAIGGLTGKQFDVRLNPDWTGTCPSGPDDPPGMNLGEERLRVILLDTPDNRIFVVLMQ